MHFSYKNSVIHEGVMDDRIDTAFQIWAVELYFHFHFQGYLVSYQPPFSQRKYTNLKRLSKVSFQESLLREYIIIKTSEFLFSVSSLFLQAFLFCNPFYFCNLFYISNLFKSLHYFFRKSRQRLLYGNFYFYPHASILRPHKNNINIRENKFTNGIRIFLVFYFFLFNVIFFSLKE
jgi:hypothetical protein